MFKIYINANNLTRSGYYCGKYRCNGEEFLILENNINNKKVKIYKTQNGLLKGIKYLIDNWVYKEDILIEEIKELGDK